MSDDTATLGALARYGEKVGLAFQVVDDILDSAEDPEGASYVACHGIDAARQRAQSLVDDAKASLAGLGARGQTLGEIADFVIARDH